MILKNTRRESTTLVNKKHYKISKLSFILQEQETKIIPLKSLREETEVQLNQIIIPQVKSIKHISKYQYYRHHINQSHLKLKFLLEV